jgi:hypothetical protein
MKPEGELGDFNRFLVDVHAIDVVGKDGADDRVLVEETANAFDAFLFRDNPAVFFDEAVKSLDEEGTGATSGIEYPHVIKAVAIVFEKLNPLPCVGEGAAPVI